MNMTMLFLNNNTKQMYGTIIQNYPPCQTGRWHRPADVTFYLKYICQSVLFTCYLMLNDFLFLQLNKYIPFLEWNTMLFFISLWALTALSNLVYAVHACMNVRMCCDELKYIFSFSWSAIVVLGKFHIDFSVALSNVWTYVSVFMCVERGGQVV